MMLEQIETFRHITTLKDGVNVLMRPMTASDEKILNELFSPISNEDARYLRDNVRDAAVIKHWCDTLDYSRVLPLMALVRDRAVGQASLHFGRGPERHIGHVRIFLARDYRRRGLGTKMINTLIELARKQGLHALIADIVADQSKVIKAFSNLGFEMCCMLEDYFMLPDGDTRDLVVLMLRLRSELADEF